jgi:hypothetical protein
MDWMSVFFTPIKPFVAHPERIMAVATALLVMFGVLGRARDLWPWPLLWGAGLWAAFAVWEWVVSREANIRVDLFVIYPVLLITTVWVLVAGLRPRHTP